MTTTTALVLFSGGQDSTTCLAWALTRFDHVETIGFDYRQRHRVEAVVGQYRHELRQIVGRRHGARLAARRLGAVMR